MPRSSVWIPAGAACLLAGCGGLLWIAAAAVARGPATILINISPGALPADGVSRTTVLLRGADGRRLPARGVTLEVVSGNHSARVVSTHEDDGAIAAQVEAGVLPGTAVLEVRGPGLLPARAQLRLRFDASDRAGDGTPDFLRLDSPADRDAFRRWFTFLAEAQAFAAPAAQQPEIVDCAALARFAYREALRPHDAAWAEPLRLPGLPAIPAVEKYAYPFTPLGASLFRVRPGPLAASDLEDGAFAEFADAKTLSRFNAYPVSRDVRRAAPGDLLFFHQQEGDAGFHTMIFLGPSQFQPAPERWVVYHTGPLREGLGEIRRVTLDDLLHHPEPRWRPIASNPFFLGVYRWNILRGTQ